MSDPRRPGRLPGGVPALDGVRGLAALLVVLTHVGYQTGETSRGLPGALLARADVGVALFFVLSGLLLYRPWVVAEATGGPAPSWRRYYRRRAVRILPAYWLALLAVVVLAPDDGRSAGDVVANATLMQVYGGGHLLGDFTQTWSLCTEVLFYAVLPLVAVAVGRLRGPVARVGLLAAVVVANLVWAGLATTDALPTLSSTWLPGHAGWFAAGMLLAAAADDAARRPAGRVGQWTRDFAGRPGTVLLLALAVAALAVTPLAGPRTLAPTTPGESVVKELLYGVVALLLVAAALVAQPGTRVARVLGNPAARWTGRVGYGVFLWHLLVLDGVMSALGTPLFGGDVLRVGVLTVAGSLAVAWLSWVLVERPLLDRLSSPVSSRREGDEQHGEQREHAHRPAADRGV
ncbi:MAG: acyltransferase [Sporichthyaceae bacterium]